MDEVLKGKTISHLRFLSYPKPGVRLYGDFCYTDPNCSTDTSKIALQKNLTNQLLLVFLMLTVTLTQDGKQQELGQDTKRPSSLRDEWPAFPNRKTLPSPSIGPQKGINCTHLNKIKASLGVLEKEHNNPKRRIYKTVQDRWENGKKWKDNTLLVGNLQKSEELD